MADSVIDLSDLKDFAKVLKKIEPQLQRDFFKSLSAAGELTATQARANASFSRKIPRTIVVKRRGLRVRIQAGGDDAPNAAPLEHGGVEGTFRHPVFGNREVWVDQQAHPFLTPAVEQTVDPGFALVVAAVDSALRGISVG